MADKVTIQLDFDVNNADLKKEIEQAVTTVRQSLNQQLASMSSSMSEGAIPQSFIRTAISKRMKIGGRPVEATGSAETQMPTAAELSAIQAGSIDPTVLQRTVIHIREIKKKINDGLALDERRIRELRRRMRFEPARVRVEMIREFQELNRLVQEALDNAIPSDAINAIKSAIQAAPAMPGGLTAEYERSLDEFAASISDLPIERQVTEVTEFVDEFTSANRELAAKLEKAEKGRLDELLDKIKSLPIDKQTAAINEYKESTGALIDDANAAIRALSDKFRKGAMSANAQKFAAFEASIEELPTQERIAAYEKWVEDGNIFPNKAKNKIRKLQGERIQEVREEISGLPIAERDAAWARFIEENAEIAQRFRSRIAKERQGIEFAGLEEQAAGLPVKEQIQLFKDYIARGGKFAKQARNNIRNLEQQRFTEVKEAAELLPIGERAALYQEYIDEGGKFANRARAAIARDSEAINESAFQETKLLASNVGVTAEQRREMWQDYIDAGGEFTEAANNEIARAEQAIEQQKFDATKLQANALPFEARAELWDSYQTGDQTFAERARQQANRARFLADKQTFDALRSRAAEIPFDERVELFEAYVNGGGRFRTAAIREIRRNFSRAQRAAARTEQIRIAELPVEEQEAAWQQYVDTLNNVSQQLRDYINSGRTLTPPSPTFQNFEDEEIQDVINRQNEMVTEARRRQRRSARGTRRGVVRQLRETNFGRPLQEQIDNWTQFATQYNEFADLANREIARLRRQRFAEFRARARTLRPREQIRETEAFAAANDDADARAMATRLRAQRATQLQRAQRRRDRRFFERTSALEPEQELAAIEEMMSTSFRTRSAEFNRDLSRRRRQVRRGIDRATTTRRSARNREFANQVLLGAGAGLGAFGAAGFPLLNVGFAAMSGNPIGTLIVAFTTAVGEATRALGRYRDANVQAAREINFISRTTRRTEATEQGMNAVIGALSIAQNTTGQRIRQERFTGDVAKRAANATMAYTLVQEAAITTIQDTFANLRRSTQPGAVPVSFGFNLFEQFRRGRAETPRILRESRANLIAEMGRGAPGIETDPYETFRRMQNAAMDPTKQREMEIMQKQLEGIDKMVLELETTNSLWEDALGVARAGSTVVNLLGGRLGF